MIVGIDFGTTKSLVSVMQDGVPRIIPDASGHRFTPSLVTIAPDEHIHVGWDAVNLPPEERWSGKHFTISSIKRLLGKAGEQTWGKYRTYPQEIASLILGQLKLNAEAHLGQAITRAVLAVPAHFDINERWATYEAAEIAGFKVERMLHEPTAAALAYGFDLRKNEKVAVFDLGGGTFDISILDIGDNVFEVLATGGNTRLGGVDVDAAILAYVADEFEREAGIDLRKIAAARQRLLEAVEAAKRELSFARETRITLPYIAGEATGPKHLDVIITRAKLEELAKPILERVIPPCRQAMSDAKLTSKDLDKVILVGAATRMPKVQQLVEEIFKRKPSKAVDPTEVVAVGAAIQAAILAGEVEEQMVLLDVTPLSLGVETLGRVMTALIERNTTIPMERKETFSTTEDNQTAVTVCILQGDAEFAKDNTLLGVLKLTGIPLARKGVPQIDVAFNIDGNGILNVSAEDAATGHQAHAEFAAGPYRLNPAQMKVLRRKVAIELAVTKRRVQEQRRKGLNEEARRDAEALVGGIERVLADFREHIGQERVSLLEAGPRVIRQYIESNASHEEMDKLVSSVRKTYQEAVGASLGRIIRSIVASQAFADWRAEASAAVSLPHRLEDSFNSFREVFERQIAVAGRLAGGSDGSAGAQLAQIASGESGCWTPERMVLSLVLSCWGSVSVPPKGLAAAQDSDLARLVLFLLLRKAGSANVKTAAATEIHRLRLEARFFLLGYLTGDVPGSAYRWLERSLFELPQGHWTRHFADADLAEKQRLRGHPVATEAIRRDAAAMLTTGAREKRTDALGVLEQISPGEHADKLIPLLMEKRPEEETIRLISLLASGEGERLILGFLRALADPSARVRAAALAALRPLRQQMEFPLSRVFEIAEKVLAAGQRPSFWERRFLAKISRQRGDLAAVATCLRRRRR